MDYELSEQDLIDKLEEIVRDDRNRAAQIAAIKQLRIMRGAQSEPAEDAVRGLYDVANPGRIRTKAA